ncbi:LysR family transcriptional regulator [Floccifex sp.]|uniref:LysR family transcriptional regulator n=1 Tax=Floccifex sp. TaxID=2815810 RepID=UPI003F0FAEDB
MNTNFELYKIFYCVAKYKNITKAAHALYRNQPNISRSIQKLEEELNCKLFVRTKKGVELTPEGACLYAHVEIAIEQIIKAQQELLKQKEMELGSISIGVTESALNIFLLEKLENFHKKYPKIHLRISNHSTPQAIQALENGLVDFSIVVTPTILPSHLKQMPLLDFQDILVGGKQYKELATTTFSLQDLKSYPLIMLGKETMTHSFFSQLFFQNNTEFNSEFEVATMDQVLPLVIHNLGLGFLPYPMAKEALEKKEIVSISIKETIPMRQVVLIEDKRAPLSMAAKSFIQELNI